MKPVHVLAVGDFGEAVAECLAAHLPNLHVTRPGAVHPFMPATWPDSRIHVLASWRAVPSLASLLDQTAFDWTVPWLPIIYEHPVVRIGPCVVPGLGPCYACFRKRVLQHAAAPNLLETLWDQYDRDPQLGPKGYPPAAPHFAAMTALEIMERLEEDAGSEAGEVRQIDFITLQTLKGRVAGIHGCQYCGLWRSQSARSYQSLADDLKRMNLVACGEDGSA